MEKQQGNATCCFCFSFFSPFGRILFAMCFMFSHDSFRRDMIIFLWRIDAIAMFFSHWRFSSLDLYMDYCLCFLRTVLEVCGSVLEREDGLVSFACWTACLSFLLIGSCGMFIPP
jgi:hypothetical protein